MHILRFDTVSMMHMIGNLSLTILITDAMIVACLLYHDISVLLVLISYRTINFFFMFSDKFFMHDT